MTHPVDDRATAPAAKDPRQKLRRAERVTTASGRGFRRWAAALLTAGVALGGGLLWPSSREQASAAAPAAAKPTPIVPSAVPPTGVRAGPVTTATLEARFAGDVRPFLQKHCYSCHANGKHKGEVALDPYTNLLSVQTDRDKWMHFSEVLKQKLMPPEDKPQPTQAEFDSAVTWINDAVNYCDCSGPRDPGRVMIHRLNRTEYNNTIRDLLGVDAKPAKDFPADETGYGFDNIADVLTVSPLLIEKYLAAADTVMEKVVPIDNPFRQRTKGFKDVELKASGEKNQPGVLVGPGDNSVTYEFVADGQYEFRVKGYQRKVEKSDAVLAVRVDGKEVGKQVEVGGTREKPVTVTVTARVGPGSRKVSFVLANPKTDENAKNAQGKVRPATRSITIEKVDIVGPIGANPPPPSPGYRKIFVSKPGPGVTDEAAAKAIFQRFATRAFRRPAQADEVESLLKVFKSAKADGENFEQSVRLGLTAMLVSPQFLFRIELDPAGSGGGVTAVGGAPAVTPGAGGVVAVASAVASSSAAGAAQGAAVKTAPHLVGEYELVTRLSYFLWSSTPDDELLGLAASRRIRDPQVLEQQVKRMLLDPRSAALVQNFAGQWLELRNLDDYKPDPKFYPGYDDELAASMKKETELFFSNVVREDRSILDLLNGDYTYVNERLAKHYGIANVTGDSFRKVSLAGTKRGGVLTQAAVLTVTAMPTRTSPVKRGKFVLENVLGTPPPPPPPDVPALSEDAKDLSKATLKVRLEEHRKDPNCAVCHIKMDAIGFSLENFDAIGQWRDKDGKFPVDSVGKLSDGTTLNGADGLRKMLLTKQDDFVATVVKKLLTYGLGRGLEFYDQCTVKDVEAAVRKDNYKFSSLVMAIVKSDAFQKRRLLRPEEIRSRQEKADDLRDKKGAK